ncbi:MAG: hypothetical protein M1830_000211 [Pleopsidium flavum]|nr:MAG: hypothetical protein M1830_000211 [Pleopsidium flavum]
MVHERKRIKRPLVNGTLPEGSDQGSSVVHFGPQPARVGTRPPPPQLDILGFSKRQDKRRGLRGTINEVLPKRLESSLKPQRPKSPLVRFINDDDPVEHHLPQSRLRTVRYGVRAISAEEESDERLDAALDYWKAQKGTLLDEPSETPSRADAADLNTPIVACWNFGSFPQHAPLFPSGGRANKGRNFNHFQKPKAMSLGLGRAIHTTSIPYRAATQQSITPEDFPASLIPPRGAGPKVSIREHLRLWQEQQKEEKVEPVSALLDLGNPGGVQNVFTRPAEEDTLVDTVDDEHNEGLMSDANLGQDGVMEFDSERPFLTCGDLVELSSMSANQQPVLAIFIREFESQAQFYTMRGKWIHRVSRYVYFSVPQFVTPTMVAEILPYLPTEEVAEDLEGTLHSLDASVPREAGSQLVTNMIHFFNASEQAYRKHSSSLDNAHNLVAHETEITYGTLSDIASKILPPTTKGPKRGSFSRSTLYAVHRALVQFEFGFGLDLRSHRTTSYFEIRPKRELRSVNQVRDWLREYQENLVASTSTEKPQDVSAGHVTLDPIAAFVDKARDLIVESRKKRAPTKFGNVGPSPTRFDTTIGTIFKKRVTVGFSETDTSIIRFFEIWAGFRSFSRYVPLNSLASMILRVIGMYEDYELDHPVGWLFLQELGVYAPWENRLVLNTRLGLPGHHITPEADQLRLQNIRAAKLTLNMTDSMQAFRKDWEDLEVFCIDDADAREIDDGISLEDIPGSDSTCWIHVHTANPSAFISKESTLAGYAAHLTETVYLPERIYPMLPPYITRSRFSLAPDRPSLTFSAKLTMSGEILEAKVTPGIIRKVTFVTPQTMRQVLSVDAQSMPETVITVGGDMPSRKREGLQDDMTGSQQHTLRRLRDFGAARRRKREKKGAVYVHLPSPETSVYLGPYQDTPVNLTGRTRACHYDGDPVVQLRAQHFDPKPNPAVTAADNLVPDLMILACEVAASWCKERNIPALYRGTVQNPDLDSEQFRLEKMQPTVEKLGYLPLVMGLRYVRLIGRSVLSTAPREHAVMGSDQYAKCTSPLRRYGDLLLHWQIESALRQEAETGKSLVGSRDGSYLAFQQGQIEAMLPTIDARERMISGVKRSSMRHWSAQLLFRAFYFNEAPLPETWEFFIFSKGATRFAGMYSGILKETSVDAEMKPTKMSRQIGVDLGDWWEVKLVEVDAYRRSVTVEAVRLIQKAGEGGS